jgi:hypothetical protein
LFHLIKQHKVASDWFILSIHGQTESDQGRSQSFFILLMGVPFSVVNKIALAICQLSFKVLAIC